VTDFQVICFQMKYPKCLASYLMTGVSIPEIFDVIGPKVSHPHGCIGVVYKQMIRGLGARSYEICGIVPKL